MSRIGFFTLPHTGHMYPATALGRSLVKRGHEVIFFNYITTKAIVRAAGLSFHPIATPCSQGMAPPKEFRSNALASRYGLLASTQLLLKEVPRAIESTNLDALVIDQIDFATGTIAEKFGLPFVNFCLVPPIHLHSSVPPVCFSWKYSRNPIAMIRNSAGNIALRVFLSPVLSTVNRQRCTWKLPPLRSINDVFSKRAIIAQIPEAFDFPSSKCPKQLFYAGPFIDKQGRRAIKFPWERLNGKPLIYASMGTRRNEDYQVFRTIAEACSGLDAQMVISTGGNPIELGSLAGDPITVNYVPQLEIMERANLVITHAGVNTTMEALSNGVPLVAVPVADDQPGVAARIERVGVGVAVPFKKVSFANMRNAVRCVLENPEYKAAAGKMQEIIQNVNGLERAADIVESSLK